MRNTNWLFVLVSVALSLPNLAHADGAATKDALLVQGNYVDTYFKRPNKKKTKHIYSQYMQIQFSVKKSAPENCNIILGFKNYSQITGQYPCRVEEVSAYIKAGVGEVRPVVSLSGQAALDFLWDATGRSDLGSPFGIGRRKKNKNVVNEMHEIVTDLEESGDLQIWIDARTRTEVTATSPKSNRSIRLTINPDSEYINRFDMQRIAIDPDLQELFE